MSVIHAATVANPAYRGGPPGVVLKSRPPKTFWQRHSGKFKAAAVLGLVGCAAIVGYVVGSGTLESPASRQSNAVPSELSQAKQVLQRSLQGSPGQDGNGGIPNVLRNITPAVIDSVLDAFEAAGGDWQDDTLPAEVVLGLKAYRDEAIQQRDAIRSRRVLGSYESRTAVRGAYRRRALLNSGIVSDAWERIEQETYSYNRVVVGDDKLAVKRDGSSCWILAEESNSAGDWFSNLDLGDEDIMSVKTYYMRDESCGCAKYTWWWCSEYRSCNAYKKLGTGYDGFTKAHNKMRVNAWNLIKQVCGTGLSYYKFAGYSRGGGVLANLVFAILKDNLLSRNKVRMVTFGAPRALSDSSSDELHGYMSGSSFNIDRIVYKGDMVPSVPYDWWGYKHAGNMACHQCDYPEERDRPYYSWNIPHHLEYCKQFGNAACDGSKK